MTVTTDVPTTTTVDASVLAVTDASALTGRAGVIAGVGTSTVAVTAAEGDIGPCVSAVTATVPNGMTFGGTLVAALSASLVAFCEASTVIW